MVLVTPPPVDSQSVSSSPADVTGDRQPSVSDDSLGQIAGEKAEQFFEDAALMVEDSPTADQIGPTETTKPSSELPTPSADPLEKDSTSEESPAKDNGQNDPESTDVVAGENQAPLLPDSNWASSAERSWGHWSVYGFAAALGIVTAVGICGLLAFLPPRDSKPAGGAELVEPQVVEADDVPTPQADRPQDAAADASAPTVAVSDQTTDLTPQATNSTAEPTPSDVAADPAETDSDQLRDSPAEIADTSPINVASGEDNPPSVPLEDTGPASLPTDDSVPSRSLPRKIDAAARLADPITAFESDGIPLMDFLQIVSDMSTIPITIDPDGLRRAGKSPMSRISVKQSDTTVAQLLSGALTAHRLTYEVGDGQMIVTKRPKAKGDIRRMRFPIADLVGKDQRQRTKLANLIRSMVTPDSWQQAGGSARIEQVNGDFVIEHTESARYKILFLCEKLRVARGDSPISQLDPSLFTLDTRSTRAIAALKSAVRLNFFRSTRLVEILNHLRTETGAIFLVDWTSLAEIGWSPDAKTTFTAADIPLADALDSLLSPLGLAYRIVDETTFQVVSEHTLNARYDVEFYPLSESAVSDTNTTELLQWIQSEMGDELFVEEGGGGVLHVDTHSESNCLIARLPQTAQMQLAELLSNRSAP